MEKKIIVASKNPVKINASQLGFCDVFDQDTFLTEGISVPSGVSDQPIGSQETFDGAFNRAQQAKKAKPHADFWIGIEGGVERVGNDMEVFAWVYVIDAEGMEGKAKTAAFYLPPKVVELIDQGMELGEADDHIFKHENSKQKGGSVGILTDGLLERTAYYRTAVILALIPLNKKELYTASTIAI